MGYVPAGQELEAVGDVAAPDDQLVDVKGRAHTGAKLHEGRYWDEKIQIKKTRRAQLLSDVVERTKRIKTKRSKV